MMAADEMFVVFLIALCGGAVLVMNIRSRREAKPVDASNPNQKGGDTP
jgi:hypothetical protein